MVLYDRFQEQPGSLLEKPEIGSRVVDGRCTLERLEGPDDVLLRRGLELPKHADLTRLRRNVLQTERRSLDRGRLRLRCCFRRRPPVQLIGVTADEISGV